MTRAQTRRGKVAALVLFALFVIALLLALVAGVRVYGALVAADDDVRADRFATGLLANSVRGADAYDAVGAAAGPDGRALVLTERAQTGTWETRLYQHDGVLLQEYALQGTPFNPESATVVLTTDTFWFTFANGLLTIGTDQGLTEVALRSAQTEAAL